MEPAYPGCGLAAPIMPVLCRATFRNQDASPKESFVYHAAGLGGRGGSSYIDSVILRDRDADEPWTSASDGALEERRFYCQNWRADVVAVTRSNGAPWEFVRYSAYGEPTVYPLADVNRDGVVSLDDLTAFGMGTTTGDFAATPDGEPDLDFDGDIGSSADIALFMDSYDANTGQSGKGRVSSAEVGNRKGYAGYEWDQVIAMSHVRYRVYWAEIGRWTRRDPLGYVDGPSLYKYSKLAPVRLMDPLGLSPDLCGDSNARREREGHFPPPWHAYVGRPATGTNTTDRPSCGSSESGSGGPGGGESGDRVGSSPRSDESQKLAREILDGAQIVADFAEMAACMAKCIGAIEGINWGLGKIPIPGYRRPDRGGAPTWDPAPSIGFDPFDPLANPISLINCSLLGPFAPHCELLTFANRVRPGGSTQTQCEDYCTSRSTCAEH